MQTQRWTLAICAGLLFVAACSSSDNSSGPGPVQEKSAIISQGDAICQQGNTAETQALDNFKKSNPNPDDSEALDFFTTVLLPIEDRTVGALHRVGEPSKDRVDFDNAVKELDKSLTDYKEEIADNPVGVLKSGTKAFDAAAKLFANYGFKECSKL